MKWLAIAFSLLMGTAQAADTGRFPRTVLQTTAPASSMVVKSSAGYASNVYVTPSAAGYLMVFNQSTIPSSGAVTPMHCVAAPANITTWLVFNNGQEEAFPNGIVVVFSSTGCFSYTPSVNAFIHANVQ